DDIPKDGVFSTNSFDDENTDTEEGGAGRNKDEGTLSEEHYVQDDYTADPFFEDVVGKDAAVTPDLERKSDETEEINIEEKKA
ncbi:hypothetical protein Tco_0621255, partial [Tanacetum coccineum]